MAKEKATTCFFALSSWLTGFSLIYLTWIIFSATAENSTVEVKVGVILDSDTVGKVGLSCLKMALSDFYESRSFYNTRLVLHLRDSNKDVVRAASAGILLSVSHQVSSLTMVPAFISTNSADDHYVLGKTYSEIVLLSYR